MKIQLNIKGMLLWLGGACLFSFYTQAEPFPTQHLRDFELKSEFLSQGIYSELRCSEATSEFQNEPFSLKEVAFKLFNKSDPSHFLLIKPLKSKYSLSNNRLMIQGTESDPGILLIFDLKTGTVYDPARGILTLSQLL